MIRIAIAAEAFEAVKPQLPGNVGVEREATEKGERKIWLEPQIVNRLRALRGPGERYSDVILRIAAEGDGLKADDDDVPAPPPPPPSMVVAMDSASRDSGGSRRRVSWALARRDYVPGVKRPLACR